MNCPQYLKDEARKFFHRHSSALESEGLLTDRDIESFSLLCELWRMIRQCEPTTDSKEAIRYISLVKQYQALAKQFGLLPRDRRKSGMEKQESLADVVAAIKRSDA